MSMADVETNGERDETEKREDETRMGHGCPETHTNEKRGETWATVACLSAKQGLGIYIDESESVAIHCTLRREREKLREKESRSRSVLPATERAASYAKGVRYSDKKQRMNVITKRDSGCEVEGSGEGRCPMAKEARGRLKERATSLR
jgi:hypothetical protein